MKKNMLLVALLPMFCTAYADDNHQLSTSPTASTTVQSSQIPPEPIKESQTASSPQPAPSINCEYHIPADKTNIEQSLITTWVSKAVIQSFDFNPSTIDAQLEKLKNCFTDQGWQGFNHALQQSGNIKAIKSQNLTVSSQLDGYIKINSVKDNQWKATLPLQVVYQNDKEKLTQQLSVEVLIGRKVSGDLGIMQMIATPHADQKTQPTTATTPNTTSSAATPTSTTEPATDTPTSTEPTTTAAPATPHPAATNEQPAITQTNSQKTTTEQAPTTEPTSE